MLGYLIAGVIIGPFALPTKLEKLKSQPLTREKFGQLIPGCGNGGH